MSNWKRFIALGLSAMMMSAALAGCGSTDSSTAEGGESADAGKTLTLCLSTRDEWLSTLADAAIAEGEALGYEVIVQDCQNDVNKAAAVCRNRAQQRRGRSHRQSGQL